MRTSPGCGCCGGPPPPCVVNFRLLQCCTTPIAGATVTATKGAFSASGTTDARGNVTLDITGGGPGSYTITSVHGGLTSVETDTLACGSSIQLDGGCFVDAFVIDCCGYHVTGATVTVKQGGTTIGTCTVTGTGPVTAAPSCFIPVPNAGTYTVECDDPCVTDPSQSVVVPHCPAPLAVGVVRFRQDSSPPTSLTDPLGNAIALTGGVGSFTYTIPLPAPSYPGTGFFPGCSWGPRVDIDRGYGPPCEPATHYDATADITLTFVAVRCGLWVVMPCCPGTFGANCGALVLRAGDAPDPAGAGLCGSVAVPMMANFEGGFGEGAGQCCPYVGEGTLTFAPTPAQVDDICSGSGWQPRWLLSAIFGDSGTFTMTG
jgi:hypothetical protein